MCTSYMLCGERCLFVVEAVGDILTTYREYIMVAWQSIRGCFAKRELSRKHTIVVTFEQKWASLYW